MAEQRAVPLPRDGAIILGDRIECAECGRSGQYLLVDLITRYARDEKLVAFYRRRYRQLLPQARASDSDPCGAICPDLPKMM